MRKIPRFSLVVRPVIEMSIVTFKSRFSKVCTGLKFGGKPFRFFLFYRVIELLTDIIVNNNRLLLIIMLDVLYFWDAFNSVHVLSVHCSSMSRLFLVRFTPQNMTSQRKFPSVKSM